jgi:hypothetical protein
MVPRPWWDGSGGLYVGVTAHFRRPFWRSGGLLFADLHVCSVCNLRNQSNAATNANALALPKLTRTPSRSNFRSGGIRPPAVALGLTRSRHVVGMPPLAPGAATWTR